MEEFTKIRGIFPVILYQHEMFYLTFPEKYRMIRKVLTGIGACSGGAMKSKNVLPPPDAELAARACAGDRDAMADLVSSFVPFIRAHSVPVAAAGLEADDMMQEGMLGLLGAVRHFCPQNGVPFRAYAHICIKRRMASAVRRATCGKAVPLNYALSLDDQTNALFAVSRTNTDPEEVVIFKETVGALSAVARAQLSSKERTVLCLYLSGVSYVGMADRLCVRVKTIDNVLQKIRKRLRRSVLYISG
ncbi:RNA polymerase, sigma-24 subunit, ECF subfamily [Ethanoligenens harbinense YUAN-3]|uniref:RNA polymerase sigma factor SigS n=2 Tax=Ethanoligenens harbinense TaxID=253239 RepID=E6U4K7_ETHHY|nr:RNA polymerase, sigma-24 subunit, ECF subfamily [Ethanoligenens harbinense YUAN-3]AVQ95756.1 hypothetical protein CXQ68_05595 [Ethanoligenens harbinense YUAN-3]AYF41163.1 hypothetical protein CN246_05595 [Ethanoligenens harbinense]QCN91995.1 hypothetical protein DRA42_05610 [Ethanoligenens harbinense]